MTQSEYKNVKKNQLVRVLTKLARSTSELEIKKATKHSLKLSHPRASRSYPIPINHPKMADWVVDGVKKWLGSCGVCTAREFDDLLRK